MPNISISYIKRDQNREQKEKTMKIDMNRLNEMIALPDDELWREVVKIGRSYGFSLPEKTPEHTELEKLRDIARDGSKVNVAGAMKILSKYRSNR